MIENEYLPYWTLGLEAAPAYIREIIPDIIRLRKLQAVEIMRLVVEELANRARRCERVGNSLKQVTLPTLFANKKEDFRKAIVKIDQLVQRDEQEVRSNLATRRNSLANQIVSDDMMTNAIMSLESPPDSRAALPNQARQRSRSRSPGPRSRQRGSPSYRGRGYPRGTSRGRGTPNPNPTPSNPPRGRARGRSSGRGNSRGRAGLSNRGNNTNMALSPAEQAIINALRNNNSQ
jgi:hypothetical protein